LKTFGNSSIDIKFAVWFEKGNFQKVKNSVFIEIKEAFDREGIEIPFPHISVYAGETTKPMPFKVVNEAGELDK
jgi:small-conductance mechanosensitive channel